MSRNNSVIVRATLTVEIDVGVWEDTISMATIRDQAKQESRNIINSRLKEKVKMIGEPKITLVSVSE